MSITPAHDHWNQMKRSNHVHDFQISQPFLVQRRFRLGLVFRIYKSQNGGGKTLSLDKEVRFRMSCLAKRLVNNLERIMCVRKKLT